MRIYGQTRVQAKDNLNQIRKEGFEKVVIDGDGVVSGICRLTCLEMGIGAENAEDDTLPNIRVDGHKNHDFDKV